ncbi:hypothetical protein Avbf_18975, partial [Armadillidium vulgare]
MHGNNRKVEDCDVSRKESPPPPNSIPSVPLSEGPPPQDIHQRHHNKAIDLHCEIEEFPIGFLMGFNRFLLENSRVYISFSGNFLWNLMYISNGVQLEIDRVTVVPLEILNRHCSICTFIYIAILLLLLSV